MATLLDIAPLIRNIEIRGVKLIVRGISAEGVVYLFTRFPILRMMMTGKEIEGMTIETFIVMAPEAVSAVIAVGLGYVGKNVEEQEQAEAIAAAFSIDEQIHALTEIMEVTLPRGVGPFVEMINSLASKAEGLGKAAAMRLGVQLNGAARTGTPKPGPTPQENSKDGSPSGQDDVSVSASSSSQQSPQPIEQISRR
jgi:hypothetical protein